MQELFKKQKLKYDQKRIEMWKECESYIDQHLEKPQNNDAKLKKGIVKIPRTKKITQYTFYNYTDKNVIGKDDAKLRYIPYIKDAKDLTGIDLYDELSFKEPVINEEMTIKTNVLMVIFSHYDDKELFELKEAVKNENFDMNMLEKFLLIEEFMKYTEMQITEVMKIWEEWFDDHSKQLYANQHTFYNHFCGVCLVFNCGIHDVIDFNDAL